MNKLNDNELLIRMRQSDENAFTILYMRYRPLLIAAAIKKNILKREAEDIVQEIFTSLWIRRNKMKSSIPLKYYLLKAVHYQYAYRLRSQSVSLKHQPNLARTYSYTWNNDLENKDLRNQILLASKKISAPACRKIFELTYLEEINCNEISELMKIKKQVVRNQNSRALQVVRKHLKGIL